MHVILTTDRSVVVHREWEIDGVGFGRIHVGNGYNNFADISDISRLLNAYPQ